ncbi:MAG: hypothetical protein AB4058_19325 [Microcystaceae cyanobacterium]
MHRLGIDEISLVKGQGKFIIVLVDLDQGKLTEAYHLVENLIREINN